MGARPLRFGSGRVSPGLVASIQQQRGMVGPEHAQLRHTSLLETGA